MESEVDFYRPAVLLDSREFQEQGIPNIRPQDKRNRNDKTLNVKYRRNSADKIGNLQIEDVIDTSSGQDLEGKKFTGKKTQQLRRLPRSTGQI